MDKPVDHPTVTRLHNILEYSRVSLENMHEDLDLTVSETNKRVHRVERFARQHRVLVRIARNTSLNNAFRRLHGFPCNISSVAIQGHILPQNIAAFAKDISRVLRQSVPHWGLVNKVVVGEDFAKSSGSIASYVIPFGLRVREIQPDGAVIYELTDGLWRLLYIVKSIEENLRELQQEPSRSNYVENGL